MDKHEDNLDTTLSIRLSTRERLQLEQLASLGDRKVTDMARHILRVERERRISALEAEWKFVGEDNVEDVARGFRAAEFSSLMKARAAHGIGRDYGLDDIAKQMADWQPPTRNVTHDPQGVPFPAHTSLSRSEPEPEAAAGAQAGARVRYGSNRAQRDCVFYLRYHFPCVRR